MQKELEYLENLGIVLLNNSQLHQITSEYTRHVHHSLQGKPGSLLMLPTLLSFPKKYTKESNVFVVEVGGTNIRGAVVHVGKQGEASIKKYKEKKLRKKKFANAETFFLTIITSIQSLIKHTSYDAIAIIYSFPGQSIKDGNDIDMISAKALPKEFVIPDISNHSVKKMFLHALNSVMTKKEMQHIPFIVMNDTSAVLFSTDAYLGGVVASGFNFSVFDGKQIRNCEAGNFSGFPLDTITQEIDAKSETPGKGLAEKQISGIYIEKALQLIAKKLKQKKLLPYIPKKQLTAEHINTLLENKQSILVLVSERLVERSARYIAIIIVGTIQSFPNVFSDSEIIIPIEGAYFWGVTGLSEKVKKYLQILLPEKQIILKNIIHAGILGAAKAAAARE